MFFLRPIDFHFSLFFSPRLCVSAVQGFCYSNKMRHALNILIAPDSFKGTLSALEAARAIEIGIKRVLPDAKIQCLPLADGGEGTLLAAGSTAVARSTLPDLYRS